MKLCPMLTFYVENFQIMSGFSMKFMCHSHQQYFTVYIFWGIFYTLS